MKQVIIENPVINSPFEEPQRHHEFDADGGPTGNILEGRRVSSYFVPIAQPRKKAKQGLLYDEEVKSRVEENKEINQIRAKVRLWRDQGYPGDITSVTRQLLEYWYRPERENPAFFCQMEAVETVIYLTEAAKKLGDTWIENFLTEANRACNPLLFRIGIKMATGSGKTAVMARLIAWHTLNKLANPQDARFADSFLIVTPGITIRDRLRVLLPSDPRTDYLERDIIPREKLADLGAAKIVITNFHAFNLRDQGEAGGLTKRILAQGRLSPFIETPDQMVRRVCREFGNKKNIIVINDEAHHCYVQAACATCGKGPQRRRPHLPRHRSRPPGRQGFEADPVPLRKRWHHRPRRFLQCRGELWHSGAMCW
jgi:type III restriction enzyme